MGHDKDSEAPKKRLTEAEFLEAVEGLEVGQQTLTIAHGVLVQGRRQSDFAQNLGLSKGAISQAVGRVWSAHQAKHMPEGYQRVCAVLPEYRAFIVRKWNEESKRRIKK